MYFIYGQTLICCEITKVKYLKSLKADLKQIYMSIMKALILIQKRMYTEFSCNQKRQSIYLSGLTGSLSPLHISELLITLHLVDIQQVSSTIIEPTNW